MSHPAIDFVGRLKEQSDRSSWLVMFQVSVSQYILHSSKVWHLKENYQNYNEFKKHTVI